MALTMVVLPLLAAASAPVRSNATSLDAELKRARAEQAAAEVETARLERLASSARSEAERLRAQQAAAARSIEAAEARITAADTELSLLSASRDIALRQLTREQQPIAALLGGLAVMAERPPLLAIADRGGSDEFVQVRVLLDSTLPVIRKRTAALSGQIGEAERLQQAATVARAETLRSRQDLAQRRDRFAALERKAVLAAQRATGSALSSGDTALAAGEDLERITRAASGSRTSAALAAALAEDGAAPARPVSPEGRHDTLQLAYILPVDARVTSGLGSVNDSGVSSRGLTLAAARGARVVAPAAGVVRFSGPFRNFDGIVIIDHGSGWLSVLLNLASPLKVGSRVRQGDPIGRALGPLGVELSQNGRRVSPAIIAGSSETLSKGGKGG
jgi:septal ring factor EnvC (AmiA/AmiB activator)